MRVIGSAPLAFSQRPFSGPLGASLYLGVGSATAINYRRNLILDGADDLLSVTGETGLGATSFQKTMAVAQLVSPADSFNYTLTSEYLGQQVFAQVRTYESDYENDTIYRPRTVNVSSGGAQVSQILGSATSISIAARDGPAMRVQFVYVGSRDGLQPVSFSLVCTAATGGGSPFSTVTISSAIPGRFYTIDVPSLVNGTTYTFSLNAINGSTTAALASGLIFACSTTGPGAITSVSSAVN